MTHYDVIVVGAAGAVGSAALWHAAQRGLRVLGLDRFQPGHDRGSSHGQTRIIREAYFEHPDYVPLVRRAYQQWRELEALRGEELLVVTGLVEIGPAEGVVIPGVRASAQAYGIELENLPDDEVHRRFPGLRVPAGSSAVLEPTAGYLHVEQCVVALAEEAMRSGAELLIDSPVVHWQQGRSHVIVQTERQTYEADRLILAAGPWAPSFLGELAIPLVVRRKPLYWYEPRGEEFRAGRGCPAFLYELPEGIFYGLPQIDATGVKLAEHTGGAIVRDPLTVDRQLDLADEARVRSFAKTWLPALTPKLLSHATCLYTLSPDEHFIVDRYPRHDQVVFAAGLSGHGFKFAPVLGEALVELAVDGRTSLPMEFLSCGRLTRSSPA